MFLPEVGSLIFLLHLFWKKSHVELKSKTKKLIRWHYYIRLNIALRVKIWKNQLLLQKVYSILWRLVPWPQVWPINTHHLISSNFYLESDVQSVYIIYPSGEFYMSWFVASDQFRQLSLLWRRHKVKAGLHCTDEVQNQAETYVCSYQAPCKTPPTLVLYTYRCV